jgi:acyl-CoA hydrolase
MNRWVSANEAVSGIASGNRVFVQGSAATPHILLNALAGRAPDLRRVEVVCLSTLGEMPLAHPDLAESFFINALFVSDNTRLAVNSASGSYVPVFLSEIPVLFNQQIMEIDYALIQVSPPDKHGFCSLGVSVDVTRAAVQQAKKVIAQVNPRMPRTHGDGFIHIRKIDYLVEGLADLPEVHYAENLSAEEVHIGRFVSSLIEDGATLQMGIGNIPDGVLRALSAHRNLGIHTEMLSDGILSLIEAGVITNQKKRKHPGKLVTSFAIGSRKLYDFLDDNPMFAFLQSDYVNNPAVIAQNPQVVAINSAIEIDLTGQVCADSIGIRQYSGVGGQMDFMRGAAMSVGGKPIIALPSRTRAGKSKIVPFLQQGAGVVTTRAHAHYIVTEYGVANLFGKNLRQRADELIRIAHPEDQADLMRAAAQRFA